MDNPETLATLTTGRREKTTTQYRKSNRWATRTTHKSLGL